MKKLFTLILAVVAVMGAGAVERAQYLDLSQFASYSSGEYDPSTHIITPSGTWAGTTALWFGKEDATNYSRIVLELAEASQDPTYVYVEYSQLKEGETNKYESADFTIAAGDTKNSLDLAYNKIIQKIEIKSGASHVDGATIKLKSLYLSYMDNMMESATPLWSDSENPITFASDYNTGKELEQSLFTNCHVGDRIRVHVKAITGSGTWSTVDLCSGSWSSFTPETKYVLMGKEVAPLDVEFTLTEDMVNIINGNVEGTNGGICMRGANYTMDEVSLIQTTGEEIDLTKTMDYGWSATYDSDTKTITWSAGWGACGWSYGDTGKDCSGFSKVVYEFDGTAPAAGILAVNYATGGESSKGFNATATETGVEYTFDPTRSASVKNISLKLSEAGSIKLKKVYFVKATEATQVTANMYVTVAAGCATFAAPFDVAIPDGVEAYKATSIDGNWVKMEAIATTIPAYTPVILKYQGATNFSQDFTSAIASGSEISGILTGNYTDAVDYIPQSSYALQRNLMEGSTTEYVTGWYQVAEANKIKVGPNRCYLTKPVQEAKTFYGMQFGEATAINNVAAEAKTKSDGKYFVNGQIVIVKAGKAYNAAGTQIK